MSGSDLGQGRGRDQGRIRVEVKVKAKVGSKSRSRSRSQYGSEFGSSCESGRGLRPDPAAWRFLCKSRASCRRSRRVVCVVHPGTPRPAHQPHAVQLHRAAAAARAVWRLDDETRRRHLLSRRSSTNRLVYSSFRRNTIFRYFDQIRTRLGTGLGP